MLPKFVTSKTSRWLELAPRIPIDLMVLISPENTVGPGPEHSWHLAHREYDGVVPCILKPRWVKRRGA